MWRLLALSLLLASLTACLSHSPTEPQCSISTLPLEPIAPDSLLPPLPIVTVEICH
jgi:hypothetical protein